MIKYLRMENFRQHASTELTFDDDQQLILIAGQNGAGKSTIVEAILYAFYGQTRANTKNLNSLLRRGAEAEGLEVELDFTLRDAEYKILRRRDNKVSSAVLYANGDSNPIMTGPDQVTEAISRLLGTRFAGFKLATVAEQKQVDGLASLSPSKRAAALVKLLRLDAVSSAREVAKESYRQASKMAQQINMSAGISETEDELKSATEKLHRLLTDQSTLSTQLDDIKTKLLPLAGVELEMDQTKSTLDRIEGEIRGTQSRIERLRFQKDHTIVPKVDHDLEIDIEKLSDELSQTQDTLAQATAANKAFSQREYLEEQYQTTLQRLQEIDKLEKELQSLSSIEELQKAIAQLSEKLDSQNKLAQSLSSTIGALDTTISSNQESLATFSLETGTCPTCGQHISSELIENNIARITDVISKAKEQRESSEKELHFLKTFTIKETIQTLTELQNVLSHVSSKTNMLEELKKAIPGLQAQVTQLETTIASLPSKQIDTSNLESQLEQKRKLLQQANTLIAQRQNASKALATLAELSKSIDSEGEHLASLERLLQASQPSATQRENFEAYQSLSNEFEATQEKLNKLSTKVALGKQEVEHLEREIKRTKALEEKRQRFISQATVASNAASILNDVSVQLRSQIKPSLEDAISRIVDLLSDGRFSEVSLSDDYELSIKDKGSFQPLSELSGGEMDLVALAQRLALAEVLADRNATLGEGLGTLILDECLGSQDSSRRTSIPQALRNLRSIYGQILLISHVEGTEDLVDSVIQVDLDPDTNSSIAYFR